MTVTGSSLGSDPGADTAPAPRTPRGRRVRVLSGPDRVLLGVLIVLPLLLILVFVWFPALASVGLSFTNWTGIGGLSTLHSVGGQNYDFAFNTDPQFWPAVRHNLYWLLVFIIIATPLGMLFAVLIDRNLVGSRVYQSLLFLPVMFSLALIGIIWQLIYSPNYGFLNTILGRTGDSDLINWLGDPKLNLWAVLVEAIWRQTPYVMVLYLAGLKGVDPTLREAAAVDGANAWQSFWRVIFPVLRPINVVIVVVTVIESLRAYDLVYINSGGSVLPGMELLSMLVTQNIIGQTTRIGYGSTLATVLLVISLVPICFFLFMNFRRYGARR
jgi:multiple sugar transport system permease protein